MPSLDISDILGAPHVFRLLSYPQGHTVVSPLEPTLELSVLMFCHTLMLLLAYQAY